MLALRDKTAPSVFAALDVRRLGGAPTYVLTDNEKTVTVEHVAGLAVRNLQTVAFARHYGLTVHTYEPADPASKGGSESTVKLAKADLVPTETNLLAAYDCFAELQRAREVFCELVNARVQRTTRRAPDQILAEERARLHVLPAVPHTVALGVTRTVAATTPMVTFDGGQYSVPHALLGQGVWVRVHGQGPDERVMIMHVSTAGSVEVARHLRAQPGSPRTDDAHFPPAPAGALGRQPKAKNDAESESLALGDGARLWLTEAAPAGRTKLRVKTAAAVELAKLRVKMAAAVELAKLDDPLAVDWALDHAAVHGRFAEADLVPIVAHHARAQRGPTCSAGEERSLTRGTAGWAALGSSTGTEDAA